MNEQEQREAIAKAAGWKKWQDEESGIMGGDWSKFIWTPPGNHTLGDAKDEPPDYLNDLNAIHEAEAWMEANAADRCFTFLAELRATILREAGLKYPGLVGEFRLAHATAKQRAEALLRTLNLWKE